MGLISTRGQAATRLWARRVTVGSIVNKPARRDGMAVITIVTSKKIRLMVSKIMGIFFLGNVKR